MVNQKQADLGIPDRFNLTPSRFSARASTQIDELPNADELAAEAYQKAAEAILRRAPNTRASAFADERPMTRRIPLPKAADRTLIDHHILPPFVQAIPKC
jgi:hypothetical protein